MSEGLPRVSIRKSFSCVILAALIACWALGARQGRHALVELLIQPRSRKDVFTTHNGLAAARRRLTTFSVKKLGRNLVSKLVWGGLDANLWALLVGVYGTCLWPLGNCPWAMGNRHMKGATQ